MKNSVFWSVLIVGTQANAEATPPEPAPITTPAPVTVAEPIPTPTTPVINCNYKIPAQTKVIDQALILAWAQNAVTQSFSFDPNSLDAQMQNLQACFTEQGWTGFNAALQKSGNLDAIKSQKLTVTSHIDGQANLVDAKDNQWKISLPIAVIYQNSQEKVNQSLNVDVTIGRKMNGDLGITQMIAAPRTTISTPAPVTPAPATAPAEPTTAPATPEKTEPGAAPAPATAPSHP